MPSKVAAPGLFDPAIIRRAAIDAFRKLDPRKLARNPVIFVTQAVSAVVTVLFVRDLVTQNGTALFSGQIAAWLWFTVLFANFAEAVAEGRGKAQADALRKTRTDTKAKRFIDPSGKSGIRDVVVGVSALDLEVDDIVLVEAGDLIPGDGEVIEGVASVNESAVTGESAPVIREAGGDRSAVTGGTTVLSDWIRVKITAAPGSTFIDRMIALVEGAERQKTPNELALSILLSGLTIIFLIVCVTLWSLANYSGTVLSLTVLIALLVCLIPTTIGGLLSAIGIAGMDRLIRFNVIATSGRAVEAAGDVDTLLLDKTGTITFGNRMADELIPVGGVTEYALAEAVLLASLADETPEGRSIVALAKSHYGLTEPDLGVDARIVPFSAHTRFSGVDFPGRSLRKGSVDAILTQTESANERVREDFARSVNPAENSGGAQLAQSSAVDAILERAGPGRGGTPEDFNQAVERISRSGGTPLAVSENGRLIGVVHLKDVVKSGIKERFAALRAMGIKTVMVTGDNPITAAAIASEAGVDDFIAHATPEGKLTYIRKEQQGGRLIAMCGDGTNDAPALAQADVGVAMQTGTQAAREAGNMVDLDSDPTKLIEIVAIGKQLLMTRGSLTTFSIANDVAKYFAIIPALFVVTYPELEAINVMKLASPQSAILSAVIFNALVIIALIPQALKGVAYRPVGAAAMLRRNLLIYGLGGIVAPFIFIKLIDVVVSALHLV
jgi:potassium-transporting ATPase ATP-binding subunit